MWAPWSGLLVPLNATLDTISMAMTSTRVAARILASVSHVMWWAWSQALAPLAPAAAAIAHAAHMGRILDR